MKLGQGQFSCLKSKRSLRRARRDITIQFLGCFGQPPILSRRGFERDTIRRQAGLIRELERRLREKGRAAA